LCKIESWQKDEITARSADSSKAYSKRKVFNSITSQFLKIATWKSAPFWTPKPIQPVTAHVDALPLLHRAWSIWHRYWRS